jgi:hypothetical protein
MRVLTLKAPIVMAVAGALEFVVRVPAAASVAIMFALTLEEE